MGYPNQQLLVFHYSLGNQYHLFLMNQLTHPAIPAQNTQNAWLKMSKLAKYPTVNPAMSEISI